ncbi:hypothetical protein LXL04_008796 [Taraxacum kok-saghyz]
MPKTLDFAKFTFKPDESESNEESMQCFYVSLRPFLHKKRIICIKKMVQSNRIIFERVLSNHMTDQLKEKYTQDKITVLKLKFEKNICSNIPNAFWNRKNHIVKLPYIKGFDERNIPSKSRAIHMSSELETHCKNEIQELLNKKLIRPSKSPWSFSAFYVMNAAEIERGSPRLVINYKPLNKFLEWIRYPIPNK